MFRSSVLVRIPAKSGKYRNSKPSPPWGRGWTAPAFSSAGAGRAFARQRVMDAQGAQPATARRRVRGSRACACSFAFHNSPLNSLGSRSAEVSASPRIPLRLFCHYCGPFAGHQIRACRSTASSRVRKGHCWVSYPEKALQRRAKRRFDLAYGPPFGVAQGR
jgi:hypothetical protein